MMTPRDDVSTSRSRRSSTIWRSSLAKQMRPPCRRLSKSGRATQGLDVESWSRGASPDDDVDSRSGVTSPNPEMDSRSAAPYSSSASMMPPVVIPIDTNVARQTLGGPAVATDNTLSEYAHQHSYPVSHDSVTGFSRDSGAEQQCFWIRCQNTLDQSVALGGEAKALDPISDANSRLAVGGRGRAEQRQD